MKIQANKPCLTLTALGVLALAACASQPKAPIAADATPNTEINRVSGSIEEASRNQYDMLAPKSFDRAVDYRNSAREKLSDGKDTAKVLSDVAIADGAIQQVKKVGDGNRANVAGVLQARTFAIQAQAPKFREKEFRDADEDLKDMGEDMEKGKYEIDAGDLAKLEKKYGAAEIGARKHGELGNAKLMIEQAESDGAKKKTPTLYETALARMETARHAIETSPHTADGYAAAVNDAKETAKKLSEVLAIARAQDASEEAALTVWNQGKQLEATHAALSAARSESARTQAEAEVEQARMAADIEANNARIAALRTENNQYASEEELKQRIEELRKTFSPEEAEVMKEGTKIVVRLKNIQFPSGRAELNPKSFETLKKVEDLISAVPARQIVVEGHTDAVGSNRVNRPLSEKRAEAVKKYLVSQGLPEELQVETEGYGSDRPLTTNKTKKGRATNRRVDIVIDTPVVL